MTPQGPYTLDNLPLKMEQTRHDWRNAGALSPSPFAETFDRQGKRAAIEAANEFWQQGYAAGAADAETRFLQTQQELIEALEFYADEDKWKWKTWMDTEEHLPYDHNPVIDDNGDIARAALAKAKGENP